MPNKNYLRGRRLEYQIVDYFRKEGYDWAQRMAGSHSPYDVVAFSSKLKRVIFIQAKTKLTEGEKEDAISELKSEQDWNVIKYKLTRFIKRRK